MHIFWHGMSCVRLQTQSAMVLVNPYQDSVGAKMPALKVEIVASTDPENEQANNIDRLQGSPLVISNPGEYESKGVFFYGIPSGGSRSLFVISAEGMTIGHPGTVAQELSDAQLELFEGVDILFLPVTGDKKAVSALLSQVEPRVVIPVQYATGKTKAKLDPLAGFAKEMGIKDTAGEAKVILKQKDLPVENTQVIVLRAA
jgi:L-ascorbate metabolism protein UlaG (beta-lactamase superfamily)